VGLIREFELRLNILEQLAYIDSTRTVNCAPIPGWLICWLATRLFGLHALLGLYLTSLLAGYPIAPICFMSSSSFPDFASEVLPPVSDPDTLFLFCFQVQIKGRVACEINTCDSLVVTELVFEVRSTFMSWWRSHVIPGNMHTGGIDLYLYHQFRMCWSAWTLPSNVRSFLV
jgi:hypothetical protein